MTAHLLLEQALHLCQHGERAPGCGPWPAETWPEWARRAEEWLRAGPVRESVDVAELVTAEMVRRASDAGYRGVPLTRPILRPPDEFMRAALSSAAADLYERGREDGRGDLIWHEERVRRECAEQLRDFAREHIDRYASQESLYTLAARWTANPGED